MTQRPIGVFDSGVGGLSVLDALVKALPNEHFVYVGDTAHMPYGERSPEEVRLLVQGIERFLLDDCAAKMLVVACNTSAGILADYWRSACPVPAVEPVIPISKALVGQNQVKKIGLLATQATVNSGRYQAALTEGGLEVVPVACTGFAKLVEDAKVSTPEGRALLRTFLEPLAAQQVDAVILGCTHYPFAQSVLSAIWQELSPNKPVAWLNPADWMVKAVSNVLPEPAAGEKASIELYVTGNAGAFDSTVRQLPLKALQAPQAIPLVLPGLIEHV